MPEYPDLTIYIESLQRRIVGATIARVRIAHPFLLRTYDPPPEELYGRKVISVARIGKRIVIEAEDELFLVVHLMIAGRLRWEKSGVPVPRKLGLAAIDFGAPEGAGPAARARAGREGRPSPDGVPGTLLITEAGSKKRASLHVVRGRDRLRRFDRGGIEVRDTTLGEFTAVIRRENHTLKRTLTDPRLIAAIGNAYSDEILHRARLSPFKQTNALTDEEIENLFDACRRVLDEWTDRLRAETGSSFPSKVTAFHPEMAVHGRYNHPCPVCGTPVQRIAYAENECNYCPACQTGGKLLADRALSRLLKGDWPATLADLEELKRGMLESWDTGGESGPESRTM